MQVGKVTPQLFGDPDVKVVPAEESDRSNHLLKCTSCQGNSEFCIERLSNCKRPFWIKEICVLAKLLFFSLERDRGSFVGEFVKMTPQVRSCGHMLSEALKHLFPQIGGKVKKN